MDFFLRSRMPLGYMSAATEYVDYGIECIPNV